jgi:hypothetical protein
MTEQTGSNSAEKLTEQIEEQASAMQSQANELAEDAQKQQNQAGQQVQATAEDAQKQLKQAGQQIQASAEDLAEQGQKAYDTAAHQTAEGIDQAAMAMGGGLRDTASAIREHAPESGVAGDMARKVASSLEQSGSYLEDQSRQGIIPESQERKLLGIILVALASVFVLLILTRGIRRR